MTHVDSDPAMSTALRLAEEMLPLLRQHAGAIDAAASFPEAGLQAMRRNGLLGLLVPVQAFREMPITARDGAFSFAERHWSVP